MPRLPPFDPAAAPDSIRELMQGAPALSLFSMVAHAQSALRPWLRYGETLLTRLELDPLLRELAILQVAHLVDSQYEWVQHVAITRALGGSEKQIEAVEQGRDADESFSDEQRMVLAFSREVILDGAAGEQAVAELAARLGARGVIELLLVIGHYMAIARLIATTGLTPDPPLAAGTLPGTGAS